MFESDRSKSLPKIRLKMENHEKYESLFRNQINLDSCFRPLHPPPFSLPRVAIPTKKLSECTVIVTPNPQDGSALESKDPKQDTHDAAVLLASMKKMIEKEVQAKIPIPRIPDLEKHFSRSPKPEKSSEVKPFTSLLGSLTDSIEISRLRTVSVDLHVSAKPDPIVDSVRPSFTHDSPPVPREELPICVSPTISPLMCPVPLEPCDLLSSKSPKRGADRRKRYLDDHADDLSEASIEVVAIEKPKPKKPKVCKSGSSKIASKETKKASKTARIILRKKFSWKNYPELENFLIDNREEYLRHSALNYTMQQKQYNNRLTERLIELASECGYVFDSKVFTFVAIRDRIRCYFKSYVQSRKKRGVIIGYAARKAGLLSEKELERSAVTTGKIMGSKGRK